MPWYSRKAILMMTDEAVDDLVKGLQKLAGTGGFSLGGWGVGGGGGLEVLTVTTSKGAFLGGGLADMKMREMQKLNQAAYETGYDMSAILSKRVANSSRLMSCAPI